MNGGRSTDRGPGITSSGFPPLLLGLVDEAGACSRCRERRVCARGRNLQTATGPGCVSSGPVQCDARWAGSVGVGVACRIGHSAWERADED